MSRTNDSWRRRLQAEWRSALKESAEFFRPLFTQWRVTVAIVVAAVCVAEFFSARAESRYEAVAHFALSSTRPSPEIQQILNRRLPSVSAAVGLGLRDPEVQVLALPGSTDARVVASASSDRQLVDVANAYAKELTAWELGGTKQRRIQDQYRHLYAQVQSLSPHDPRRGQLETQLIQLQPRVVSDAQFHAARVPRRTKGPEPLERGAVAFGVGLVLALAVTRALRMDERHRREASSGPL